MGTDSGFFATKSISLNICGGRKPQTLMDAARHNLREIQAERGADSHIDASRIVENVLLAGPGTAEGVQALAGEWLAGAGVDASALRRDHCQAIEVLFSLHEQSGIEPVAYFRRCLEWVSTEMRLPILSAVIHMDEKTPHCHALLLPVREGKHVGSYPIARQELRGLRDSFFNTVAGPAGLKRMGAKMVGEVKRMAVAAVLRTCEAQGLPEKNGVLWPVFRAAIERDPTKAVQALNLSEKEIRAGDKGAPNPIGFAGDNIDACQNPIGFEEHPEKTRTLSLCRVRSTNHLSVPSKQAESDARTDGAEADLKVIETLGELWATVGCRSVWTMTGSMQTPPPPPPPPPPAPRIALTGTTKRKDPDKRQKLAAQGSEDEATAKPAPRLEMARAAMERASPVHKTAQVMKAAKVATPAPPPPLAVDRDDGDGVVRVRDEFADDLSAWGDY
jgi:hypothetical protein